MMAPRPYVYTFRKEGERRWCVYRSYGWGTREMLVETFGSERAARTNATRLSRAAQGAVA